MEILYIIAILVAFYFFKKKNILNKIKNKSNNSTHYSQRVSKKTNNSSKKKNISSNIEIFLYEKLALMKKDFVNNPYSDKFSFSEINRRFIFENGDILQMRLDNNIYKLEYITSNRFSKKKEGKSAILSFGFANVFNDFYAQTLKSSSTRGQSHTNIHKKTKHNNNNLYTDLQLEEQDKYYKLLDIYEKRKSQLDKLSVHDSSKYTLENELKVVERKLLKIKPRTGL